jgi:hypothetical protein
MNTPDDRTQPDERDRMVLALFKAFEPHVGRQRAFETAVEVAQALRAAEPAPKDQT